MKKQTSFLILLALLSTIWLPACYSEQYRYEHRLDNPYLEQRLLWQQAQQCAAKQENCFRAEDGLHANLLVDYVFFNMEFGNPNEGMSSSCQLFEFSKIVLASEKPVTPNSLKQSYQQLYPGTLLESQGPGKGTQILFPQCKLISNSQRSLDSSP